MTCKDCIHYCVCKDLAETLEMEGCICNNFYHFKDQSRIIELPCKVGDKVYVISNKRDAMGYFVDGFEIIEGEVIEVNMYESKLDLCISFELNISFFMRRLSKDNFYIHEFNKIAFIDKSKAEAKLKELNDYEMSI